MKQQPTKRPPAVIRDPSLLNAQHTIVLVGPMGAGKSSVGSVLARKLGYEFCDTDIAIASARQCSICEIFEREGEAQFRNYETTALRACLAYRPQHQLVLATGGGIVLSQQNRQLIAQCKCVVFLQVSESQQAKRLAATQRPLLTNHAKLATLNAMRMPHYAALAHFTVNTDQQSIAGVATYVYQQLFTWQSNTEQPLMVE